MFLALALLAILAFALLGVFAFIPRALGHTVGRFIRWGRAALAFATVLATIMGASYPSIAWAVTPGVSADAVARVNGSYAGSTTLNGTPMYAFDVKGLNQFTAGTGAGQADLMFSDTRTIAASGSDPLNLTATLKDPFGQTLSFLHVKAIVIIASKANTNNVVVGNAASHPFLGPLGGTTPTIAIPPGGSIVLSNPGTGWAVVASTSDQLGIANSSSGTGVTYQVIIIGTST